MLRLVVIARRSWWGQHRGEWGAGDGSMSLHATGGQGELHKSFAERPDMSLLQILQSIILVHFPRAAHSLHCGATLSAHLGTSYPSNVEGGAHRGRERRLLGLVVLLRRLRRRTMATEVL